MNLKPVFATLLVVALAMGAGAEEGRAENIDPDGDGSRYVYGENVGWLNFQPNGPGEYGAEVADSQVSGHVWAENIGWINLRPANNYGGVVNDGHGNLSGHAWGENVGWINFRPTHGGVTIDADGNFNGWAWGENIGWVHFRNDAIPYKVQTAWVGNTAPTADAGINIAIASKDLNATVIHGTATDADGDPMDCRWLEGGSELIGWTAVSGSACDLPLAVIFFSLGQHTLTLEVKDDKGGTAADDMILTVGNSAPNAVASGAGTYALGDAVFLGGQVSDFDGDALTYDWFEGAASIGSGDVNAVAGGTPVNLPPHPLYPTLGSHIYTLWVDDGTNAPVTSDIVVNVVDSTAPTLAPVSSNSILWPPNGKMVGIVIAANAIDDLGGLVTLSAAVSSDEAESGLWGGDVGPDWTAPAINQNAGTISLQFRAERDPSGDGRVYTVTITATDDAGNSSQAPVTILGPHDQGKRK
jgi:hypothetical protein